MNEQRNNEPLQNVDYSALAKSLARSASITIICAAVSMFIGGVLLSGVSVIVGAVALRSANKTLKAAKAGNQGKAFAEEFLPAYARLKGTVIAAAIALAVNAASVAYMWPQIQEQLAASANGNLSQLLGSTDGSSSSGFWGSGTTASPSASPGGTFW